MLAEPELDPPELDPESRDTAEPVLWDEPDGSRWAQADGAPTASTVTNAPNTNVPRVM